MTNRLPHIIKLRGDQSFSPLPTDLDGPTIIDLSGIAFASSRLLQSLANVKDQAIIAAPSPGVQQSLSLSGLDQLLDITATLDEAIDRAKQMIRESQQRSTKAIRAFERTQTSIQRSLANIEKAQKKEAY